MAERRNLEQTRELLLETGAMMLLDGGIGVTLDVLNLIDVCRAAGLKTAGSAYKIWSSQDEFRADVLDRLVDLTPTTPEAIAQLTASTRSHPDELPPLSELIRTIATDPARLAGGPAGYGLFSALVLASRNDQSLARRIHSIEANLMRAFADLYELLAARYDRVWVPPFDAQLLSITLSALVEGVASRSTFLGELTTTRLMRPGQPGESERPWTIYGACAEAIIEAFTRPRCPNEPKPIFDEQIRTTPTVLTADHDSDCAKTDAASARRRSLEQTRMLLLDTATRLLIESGFDVTIGRLDLLDVSRAAGLSTAGSAYKIWSTQEDYRVDLLRHLFDMSLHGDETPGRVLDSLGTASGDVPPLSDLIRVTAADNVERNSGTAAILTIALELAAEHDAALAADLHAAEHASLVGFTAMYDNAIGAYGRRWRPPFDARVLALALNALVYGFSIRILVTPEMVPTDLGRSAQPGDAVKPWHLFACAVEAIIMAFTQPGDLVGAEA